MLEFVNENKKVRLWYEFDSKYADDEELYAQYDFDEFHYDIDIDEVKEEISYWVAKITDNETHSLSILDALNELDQEKLVNWFTIIEGWEDELVEHYEDKAMEQFIKDHYIYTEDDHNDLLIDLAMDND